MVNWRCAAYIGLFLIPVCVLAPGCGEPGDPPPEAADQEEGFEIEIDLGSESEPPAAEPPTTEPPAAEPPAE